MADDVTINIRTRGGRQAAREADLAAAGIGRIGTRARIARGSLRQLGRATTSAAGGLRSFAGTAAYAGVAIGAGLLVELKRSTAAWEEKRQIIAQTEAVLKSTAGAANVTAGDVDRLSTALSRKTGMDDEAIRDAQNLILTFRDVRNEAGRGNDVYTQATRTTVDLAAAMHMDLRSAALQVGKALNDPARGFKRLQRIGVAFSKTQEDQIKGFSDVGDRAGAQRVILAELNKEFGGSAAKQATPLKRLAVSWGNIEEAIGQGVSPAVDGVASSLDRMLVRAEPDLLRLNTRLTALFKRKDLDLGQKLSLGTKDAQRTVKPYEDQLRRQIGAMKLGDKIEQAIDYAAPYIGRGFGKAAPKAASAFVSAFTAAGPWGQLITVGFLATKLGLTGAITKSVWGIVASRAAGRFKTGWGRGISGLPCPDPCAGVPGGKGKGKGKGRGGPTPVPAGKPKGSWLRRGARGVGKVARWVPEIGAVIGGGEAAITGKVPGWVPLIGGKRLEDPIIGGPKSTTSPHDPIRRGHLVPRLGPQLPQRRGQRHAAAPLSRSSQPPIITVVKLNDREIARAVHRVGKDAQARKRGG